MKKNRLLISACLSIMAVLSAGQAKAQSGTQAYEYLNIPTSAHVSALGGVNASIDEDDVSVMFDNPALLANVSDLSLNFNYSSFVASSQKLSAGFARQLGDRGTWAVGAQYFNYGKMTETNSMGEEIGTFSASDIDLQGSYAYMLSDYWSGAATAKFLFSNYAGYNAFAMGVDLGLNYFNEEKGSSLSLVAKNLGGQLKSLYETKEKLPFDLTLGFSQTLQNAPVRLSVTMDDITHWKDLNFFQHFIIGADFFPSNNTWVALGYNLRRAKEMKANGSSHWAGLSIGGGIDIKRIKIGVAWGKYHIGASSLTASLSYTL